MKKLSNDASRQVEDFSCRDSFKRNSASPRPSNSSRVARKTPLQSPIVRNGGTVLSRRIQGRCERRNIESVETKLEELRNRCEMHGINLGNKR